MGNQSDLLSRREQVPEGLALSEQVNRLGALIREHFEDERLTIPSKKGEHVLQWSANGLEMKLYDGTNVRYSVEGETVKGQRLIAGKWNQIQELNFEEQAELQKNIAAILTKIKVKAQTSEKESRRLLPLLFAIRAFYKEGSPGGMFVQTERVRLPDGEYELREATPKFEWGEAPKAQVAQDPDLPASTEDDRKSVPESKPPVESWIGRLRKRFQDILGGGENKN